jgi:hypothetical protein
MCKQGPETEFHKRFEANNIDDAKGIAVRVVMWPETTVYVFDTKLQQRVMDFDDERYRN